MRTFLMLAALACATPASAAASLDGRWQGTIAVPGGGVGCTLDLDRDAGGTWTGSVTFPEWNVRGARLEKIEIRGADASFSVARELGGPGESKAGFHAKLGSDGTLSGEFTQAGNTALFALKKTGAAEVEPVRASTAIPVELEGPWVGQYVGVGDFARQVTLTLKHDEAGAGAAEFIVLSKQRYDLPVDFVGYGEQLLRVESSSTGIVFEGRYADGTISGNVEQGPYEFPLVLKRKQGE